MKAKRSIIGIVSLVIVIGIVAAAMVISEASDTDKSKSSGTSGAGAASGVSAPVAQASLPIAASDTPDAGTAGSDTSKSIPAETEKNDRLEEAIIKEIGFPAKEDIESTRYYYNLVDLNNDGTDEVFAELVGPYTSGTGGDTGLIFTQDNGAFKLLQRMTLVRNPVVICDTTTNGWHDISMTLSGGGGAPQTVLMKFDGAKYPNPGEADPAEGAISGTAIISNDIAADTKAGKGLYLTAKE